MNKKGFVLAEAIVVAVFVLGMFTYLAMNIFPLITKYDQAINYDNPNEVYMANVLYEEILQTGKIDDLEEGMYSFKVDEENNNIDVYYTNPDGIKTEDISSLNSKFFQTDYYKNLIHNELRIKNIVVLKADAGDRVDETAQSILSTKSGLTRGMRNYYNYLKGRKEFSTKRFSILVEFASGKYASVSLKDYIYCFLTDDTDDSKLKVIGWESACGPVPADLEIPSHLYLNNDEDGSKFDDPKEVVAIAGTYSQSGNEVFQNKNIKTLTLPYSIETIGQNAFYNNQISKISYKDSEGNIKDGSLPSSLKKINSYAFMNNRITGELILNENLTEIGDHAFYIENDKKEENQKLFLMVPEKVTAIGEYAFTGNNFEKLTIVKCNSYICSGSETRGNYIFGNTITNLIIKSGIIGYRAFYKSGLRNIVLEAGVDTTHNETNAFYENNIESLEIGNCTEGMCVGTSIGRNKTFSDIKELTIKSGIIGIGGFRSSQIKQLSLGSGVTSIGDYAFRENKINQLNLSDTKITSVSAFAFYGNEILGELKLPSNLYSIGMYAFSYNKISKVLIPSSVTSISSYAFSNNSISDLNLLNVQTIGNYAFSNNPINELTVSDKLTKIYQNAFDNTERYPNNLIKNFTLPSSVTSVGTSAFAGNRFTNLTIGKCNTTICAGNNGNKIFGNQITNLIIKSGDIGNGAFSSSGIKSLTLEKGVTSIANASFRANNITGELKLPDTLTSIGNEAFYNNKISELKVPKTIYNIGTSAFTGNAFTNLTIEKCNSTICSSTQQSATGGGTGNRYFGNNIINLTIEGGTIGKFAFAGMASNGRGIIKKLVLGPNVTSVGYRAFMHNRISVLQMSEGPIEILQEAFYDNSLTSITIPQTVTTIGKQAFAYQTNDSGARTLKNITMKKTRANFLNTVTLGTVWYDTALNPTITCAGAPCTLS